MIKGYKIFFERKSIHYFNVFFNAESIDSFVYSISYTVSKIIKETKKKT